MLKTVTLQTAQELLKSGFPQEECSHYWYTGGKLSVAHGWELKTAKEREFKMHSLTTADSAFLWIAAPIAEEVLELLPETIEDHYMEIWREDSGKMRGWLITYPETAGIQTIVGQSLAEAAAKCWLYLAKKWR